MNEETPIDPETSTNRHADAGSSTLQRQFLAAMVAVLLSQGALLLFLWRQDTLIRRDLAERRPGVNAFISEYHRVSEPSIKSFALALQGYARTNTDFNVVLERYRLDMPLTAAKPSSGK